MSSLCFSLRVSGMDRCAAECVSVTSRSLVVTASSCSRASWLVVIIAHHRSERNRTRRKERRQGRTVRGVSEEQHLLELSPPGSF